MTKFVRLHEANAARQRLWDSAGALDLTFRSNELAGEVGEACNIAKKLERERRGLRGSRSTADRLAEELADVVICADLVGANVGRIVHHDVATKFNATSTDMSLDVFLYTRAEVVAMLEANARAIGANVFRSPVDAEDLAKDIISRVTPLLGA